MRERGADDILRAAVWAGLLSGAPSTAVAVARRTPVLEATEAAGTMVVSADRPRAVRLGVAALAHGAITMWWTAVLALVLPRRRATAWGAVAGVGIAALDLGVIARRRFPAVAALSQGPQVADHVAFGLVVGAVFDARRRRAATAVGAISGP